ncbi:hypothetical protein NDU88_004097 [Pleurodeles waltl]|uniref:Uncharacterized protein n=1 Tax=Pleurodeles waltl TaxID=8319 RepID=A0AAV7M662_PLEWA|nr:hypothetical protein NDU88_004097 [Pleurodeles waltl]
MSAGGGAAARSRPSPSDPASVDPAPASSGGPRESLGVRVPLKCALALLGPRLGANDVERPAPGPGAGVLEVRLTRGGPSPRAAAALGKRNAPAGCRGATPWPGGCSRPLRVSLLTGRPAGPRPDRCCGAPAATPQPESPLSGRSAARAPQSRLLSDFTGESNGAAPLPRVRRTHLGRANLFFGPGHRLRLASPVPLDHFRAS